MATIKTIKYVCPDCKRKVNLLGYPQRKLQHYGCELRTCRHCGTKFIDTRIAEIGLYDKEKTFPRLFQVRLGWLMYDVMVVIFWAVAAVQTHSLETAPVFLVALAAGLVIEAASDALLFERRKRRWQKEYDRSRELLADPAYFARVTGRSLNQAQQ